MKWNKLSEEKPEDGLFCLCKHSLWHVCINKSLHFDLGSIYLVAYYDSANPESPWVSLENNENRYSGEEFECWIYALEIDREASHEVD